MKKSLHCFPLISNFKLHCYQQSSFLSKFFPLSAAANPAQRCRNVQDVQSEQAADDQRRRMCCYFCFAYFEFFSDSAFISNHKQVLSSSFHDHSRFLPLVVPKISGTKEVSENVRTGRWTQSSGCSDQRPRRLSRRSERVCFGNCKIFSTGKILLHFFCEFFPYIPTSSFALP